MSRNGTPLLCANNPDYMLTKKNCFLGSSCGESGKKMLRKPRQKRVPQTHFSQRFLPYCLSPVFSGTSHLLIPYGGFILNCSELIKKGKKIYLYLPASLLCLWGLSVVLVMAGIKPIKIKLQKSIKFFTLHPFVVSEYCMFSSSYLPKQQSHLLFDLCKLKQVWSSLGSELWLHLLVKLFIQAIPTLYHQFVVNSCRLLIYTITITKLVEESQMDKLDKRWEKEAGKAPGTQYFCAWPL